jgi:uncharacterized membrane protein YhaH (DUF805 family)
VDSPAALTRSAAPAPPPVGRGWGPLASVLLRFAFTYWLLYTLPLILAFPGQLASLTLEHLVPRAASPEPPPWLNQGLTWLSTPGGWLNTANDWLTPRVSAALLGVTTEHPTDPSGSGDRLFAYCTAFTDLVLAVAVTVLWTAASLLWRRWRSRGRPDYDRLHAWMRLVVRFHLMYQMIVYGAIKVWCGQFPPIADGQLEVKYGDSSPMGLLWRFMQFSQPYTSATGVIEFTCGVLFICRRTTLLGALLSLGATLQVFLLNMCYDVPVKLMSGHLVLMALTLIAPDAPRLATFFVLGRPVAPRPPAPLFGRWRRVERAAVVLRTLAFGGFAALQLFDAYQDAATHGILAPEDPAVGRWVGKEFVRDGEVVPFPEQPENPPPQQFNQGKWRGGPGMPAVIRANVGPWTVTFGLEDGSGVTYRKMGKDRSEFVLTHLADGRPMGRLAVSFPEPDVMVLEGRVDGQGVRMTLRRIPPPAKKEYPLRSREFRWVQEHPFNR